MRDDLKVSIIKLNINVMGLTADVEFDTIETGRDVAEHIAAVMLGLCSEDGDLPDGTRLLRQDVEIELDQTLAEQNIEDGAVLTLEIPLH